MILNLGHTVGHALEAETGYTRFLHGEAVSFGMRAVTLLAQRTGHLADGDAAEILKVLDLYGRFHRSTAYRPPHLPSAP